MKLAIWLLYFIPAILIELVCYVSAPIVALFIRTELRRDVVKRLNKRMVTMPRDYLIKPLMYFQTHDNSVDEWWYGMYNVDHWFKFARNWTQSDYDNSKLIRWYCRMMWLQRNSMYTFNRKFFGINPGSWLAWQYKADIPLWFGYYNSVNIGWKAHKGITKLMYAGRILGIRK